MKPRLAPARPQPAQPAPEEDNPKSQHVLNMFSRGTPPPPQQLRQVLRQIQVIPEKVLELIDNNNTSMVYLKEGERPQAPVDGLLQPVDPQEYLQKPKTAKDVKVATALSFEHIARSAGAKTPEQIQEFSQLLAALNPNLPEPPELKGWLDQVPLEQRPLTGPVMVPNLLYKNDILLDKRQADWLDVWQSDQWSGYYRSDLNTLFLREGRPAGETSTAVHELGHAFGDALADLHPEIYASLKQARDEAYKQKHFPTDYSKESPSEFFAESFAIRFEKGAHALEPTWADALENALLAGGSGRTAN